VLIDACPWNRQVTPVILALSLALSHGLQLVVLAGHLDRLVVSPHHLSAALGVGTLCLLPLELLDDVLLESQGDADHPVLVQGPSYPELSSPAG
jgi:hypothetical protein